MEKKKEVNIVTILLIVLAVMMLFSVVQNMIGDDMTNHPLVDPNVEIVTTDSGLQYQDTVVGTGQVAKAGDAVSVHYTGMLEDGTKFDSSVDRNQPFEFNLGAGRVIGGWDEGVQGLAVGGQRVLIIPSDLGYGPSGREGVIPPNATLIFLVELLAIN